MKKLLKFLLVLVIALVAIILIAGLVMPNEIEVTRSVLIRSQKDVVFEQMVKFRNWPNWSPWLALDTNAKLTYEGTDGEAGSSYTWDSKVFDVGMGTTKNTGVARVTGTPSASQMSFHIDFFKPFENKADGLIKATDTAGMVKATWSLKMHAAFPMNALQLFPFMSMEKMVGKAFEQGLAKMKAITESQAVAPVADPITYVDYAGHNFQGMRQTVGWAEIPKFFGDFQTNVGNELSEKASGPATGLYYTWDTVAMNTDMVAAYPVTDTNKRVLGCSIFHVEPAKAYLYVYKGGYANMMSAHMALTKRLAEKNAVRTLVIEEYAVGAPNEPDSNKWVTNVYYLVK